jgi:hypothetical protein
MTLGHILKKLIVKTWLWAKRPIFFLLGFALGFFIGTICRQNLVFKNEVQVGDFVNLFTGLFVALFLQNIIQKQFSNARVEKDLLIARLTALDLALTEVHKLFVRRIENVSSVEPTAIQSTFKSFTNSLYMLEKALEKCQPRMNSINIEVLKSYRGEYRKLVTGGNFPSGPYDIETINKEDHVYRDISIELQSLIFEINNK